MIYQASLQCARSIRALFPLLNTLCKLFRSFSLPQSVDNAVQISLENTIKVILREPNAMVGNSIVFIVIGTNFVSSTPTLDLARSSFTKFSVSFFLFHLEQP